MTRRSLVICTAAAFVACGVGLLIDPRAMLASYLTAWFALSAIPMGALGVLFTTYLVRGGWTQDLHAPLSRAAFMNPVAALLFIPVLAGLSVIYPWAEGAADLPPFKSAYLAPLFFALRSAGYFAVWTVLAIYAHRVYGDRARMERAAAIGLIVWAITVSFAGIDWLESIEPKFHSSIYGLLVLSFTVVAAFAFGLAAVLAPARPRRMANSAYAGLLLSVLLLWAYLHAMQYIIVWAGNIPDEVSWYAVRAQGGWSIALSVLFIGQFIVPFFALLSARVRASTRALMAMAAVTLAFRYLEASVLILPPLDLGAGAVAGCLTVAIVATASAFLLAWRGIGQILDRAARSGTARGECQPADAAGEEPNGDYRGAGEHA